ncbi:MAG: cupin domain-containing protein [Cyanobacteriota bacterium]|nr:cupin domain-containing protein [Cyanobacteriota bacterium]
MAAPFDPDTPDWPLVALAALGEGTLSVTEQMQLAEQLIRDPQLEEEGQIWGNVWAALPYGLPFLSADQLRGIAALKSRVMQGLEPPDPPLLLVRRLESLLWREIGIPGVVVAILHEDPQRRQRTALLKAAPGSHYPWHRHAGVEEILMLEGSLVVGEQVFRAGDYLRSDPGSVHGPHTEEGCLFLVRTSMDDQMLGMEPGSVNA